MDTVILAAGESKRLNGVVPPYGKPLIPINGVPLIVSLVRNVHEVMKHRIVIVAAPSNVAPMVDLLEAHGLLPLCTLIIQPRPVGPGNALWLGLQLSTTKRTLVLMGDNVVDEDDIHKVLNYDDSDECEKSVTVGIRLVSTWNEAQRFTRMLQNGNTTEGPDEHPADRWNDGKYRVWCGPLVVPTARAERLYETFGDTIGNRLPQAGDDIHLVQVNVIDIGVPDALGTEGVLRHG